MEKIGTSKIELVKTLYQLFAQKDMEAIKEILHPQVVWQQMRGFPGGGSHLGADVVIELVFGGFGKDWEVWKAQVDRYLETSDGVLVMGSYSGTYKSTGKSMQAAFACEYLVEEGKITAFQQYTDTFLIAQAMGLSLEGG